MEDCLFLKAYNNNASTRWETSTPHLELVSKCVSMEQRNVAKKISVTHFSSLRLNELCRQQAVLTRQIITTFMTGPIDWGVSDPYSTAVVLSTPKGLCGSGEKHRCRAKGHGMHLFSVSCSLVFLSPPPLLATSNASIVTCESQAEINLYNLSERLGFYGTCLR